MSNVKIKRRYVVQYRDRNYNPKWDWNNWNDTKTLRMAAKIAKQHELEYPEFIVRIVVKEITTKTSDVDEKEWRKS